MVTEPHLGLSKELKHSPDSACAHHLPAAGQAPQPPRGHLAGTRAGQADVFMNYPKDPNHPKRNFHRICQQHFGVEDFDKMGGQRGGHRPSQAQEEMELEFAISSRTRSTLFTALSTVLLTPWHLLGNVP